VRVNLMDLDQAMLEVPIVANNHFLSSLAFFIFKLIQFLFPII